jgi:hypothetical protein
VKILLVTMLLAFVWFLIFGKVEINGAKQHSIRLRFQGAALFGVTFGLITGLIVLGFTALL